MDLNKLDDIFKEGLEGYSQQPSKGLWKKVSGGLLRYEISHFNFTNLPKLWIGVAAASIVAVSLIIFNPLTNNTADNAIITATEKESPGIESSQANQSISIPTETETDSKQSITGTPNSLESRKAELSSIIEEKIISVDPSTENQFGDITHSVVKPPSFEDESAINPGENTDKQQNFDQSKIATTIVAAAAAVNKVSPEPGKIQTKLINEQGEVEISEMESRQANLSTEEKNREVNEIFVSPQPTILVSSFDRSDHESGKIQRMHSLSYSFGQFFKGKYKAPKRRFNEKSSALYKGNTPYYSIAAYFSPELTEYARTASTSKELSYIAGVALSYNNSRFMVEGGVELSYSDDVGDYMVDMQTFDSIGYYNEVGGFVPDPDNPGSVIFETNMVPVYDSVQHNLHQQTQNQYTYLQFPLMVGYQAMESGIFSAYIKAGPSFSFLLNRQEQNIEFYDPDATINQIENYTPTRRNTSIQVLVSVSMKFQLSEKMGFMVEPTYRYYLKSVYDNNNSSLKNPYGIGVRGGLYFDL